jgi:aldose 1-epimerase
LKAAFLAALLPGILAAQNYSVEKSTDDGIEVIHLIDKANEARVSVVPTLGNRAIEFSIHGKNILFFPAHSLTAEKQKPSTNGIPFLAPWANRLDEAGFWANDHHYSLNPDLSNYSLDNNKLPIHGLLTASDLWRVMEAKADEHAAYVTCRLEFWKHPELMAQWPFAQEYDMTYRLSEGELEVRTSVVNLSAETMPLSFGFHPYYRLPDHPRDEWTLTTPADSAVVADAKLIPTGEIKPSDLPDPLPMKDHILDNGFTGLARDAQGRAHFRIQSGSESIDVTFGPRFQVAVLWEPPARGSFNPQFICIEPMTGITDAVNLNHRGLYPDLQTLAPGARWTESFWIKPQGM